MTAPQNSLATALLRRVGLLCGVLAIIAGIFGMHVMTGTHSMHTPAAVVGTADAAVPMESPAADDRPGHETGSTPATHRAPGVHDRTATSGHSCWGNCTCTHAMAASCTPSAQTGSLAAPLPGIPGFTVNVSAGTAGAATGHYTYLPGGPSPGELSISRT